MRPVILLGALVALFFLGFLSLQPSNPAPGGSAPAGPLTSIRQLLGTLEVRVLILTTPHHVLRFTHVSGADNELSNGSADRPRNRGEWRLGDETPAAEGAMRELLAAILETPLDPSGAVSEVELPPVRAGLAPPALLVEIQGKDRRFVFRLGTFNQLFEKRYLQIEGEPLIYLVRDLPYRLGTKGQEFFTSSAEIVEEPVAAPPASSQQGSMLE